jgi:hypothetical protein
MVIQWQTSFLKFDPVEVFGSYPVFFHRYTIIHRADQLAKVTTYTFFFFNCIGVVWIAGR